MTCRLENRYWLFMVRALETPFTMYLSAQSNIPESLIFQHYLCEDLKSRFSSVCFSTAGLIPCNRQGTCCCRWWSLGGNVTLLCALVCTQPLVYNHTRWNRRDKQQSTVAVVTGLLWFHPVWIAMCHHKFPATFHWKMRAAVSSSCQSSYPVTADTHRGPLWWQTAVLLRCSEYEGNDEDTKGGTERQEDSVHGVEMCKGGTE
jgi:hypothetical protein